MSLPTALPTPVFEGSEKRIEVHFKSDSAASSKGLRALTRSTLDHLLKLASCEIVSKMSNDVFDAYVLSESSLFVYPTSWVLKTCGTTNLLNCLPALLDTARGSGLSARSVKYSRASFLFPDDQPHLYQSFDREVDFLRTTFGPLGHHGSVAILGDAACDLQWHLFTASDDLADVSAAESLATTTTDTACVERNCDYPNADGSSTVDSAGMESVCGDPSVESSASSGSCISSATVGDPLSTFEVCMTELDESAAQQFVRTGEFVSSAHTTQVSGIRALVPEAHVDDYVFEPCGYSMNGVYKHAFMTIHVTPESGFSYASCELHGFCPKRLDPSTMASAISAIFKPRRLVVTCSTSGPLPEGACAWALPSLPVPGYVCETASSLPLPTGGFVRFYTLAAADGAGEMQSAYGSTQSLVDVD